jgi:CrcB protein
MLLIGGGLGAVSRYSVSVLAARYIGTRLPWGTLIANMAGCFLIGVLFALADRARFLTPLARLFLMTGFLGALTTFSTFALETVQSIRNGSNMTALINFCLNNIGGVILVLAGIFFVQYMFSQDIS